MSDLFRQWWRQLLQRTDTPNLRLVRRVIVAVIGSTVLLLGVIMIVLPGPAFLVIPAGLAILGLEFEWARLWLRRVRAMAQQMSEKATGKTSAKQNPAQQKPTEPERRVEVFSGMQRRAGEAGR